MAVYVSRTGQTLQQDPASKSNENEIHCFGQEDQILNSADSKVIAENREQRVWGKSITI